MEFSLLKFPEECIEFFSIHRLGNYEVIVVQNGYREFPVLFSLF